jgi:electron transport complex protein RnfC
MKRRKMRGGVRFGTFQGTPRAFGPDAFPKRLWVPLRQGYGEAVQPLVSSGEKVLAEQIIGRDDGVISTPIHAPLSGSVEHVGSISENGDGENFIVIAADEREDRAERKPVGLDFERQPSEEIARALYECGVTALGRTGIPSPFKSCPAEPDAIDTLIVAMLETFPLSPGVDTRLNGRWKELASGIQVLRRALAVDRVIVAFSSDEVRKQFIPWLNQVPDAEVRKVSEKYPQDWDETLVEALAERRVPDGGLSTDVGVVCIGINAALAAYAAVLFGQPLIRQEVALVGSGLAQPEIVRAPIGTAVSELLGTRRTPDAPVRVILGDPLVGIAVEEGRAPVSRGLETITVLRETKDPEMFAFLKPGRDRHSHSNAFVSALVPSTHFENDTGLHGEERPCICCNYCDEVCPRDLMPYQLSKLVRIEEIEEARVIHLTACIECCLCSYVCPSKIPLLEDIRRGKQMLAEELAHEEQSKTTPDSGASEG